jgi:succinate dehydrogenase / fumarate reductase cytochrome b subunit
MSYITYASIIFHAVDGILLTIQNKKARPVNYVYNNPSANSSLPSRWMALLGSLILVFIVTHMANFWWKMKISEEIPLHTYKVKIDERLGQSPDIDYYYTHVPSTNPIPKDTAQIEEKGTELFLKSSNLKLAEGYRDLHTVVMDFFNPDVNDKALLYLLIYVISMGVLAFHLWHGFASAFQSLGLNHAKYNTLVKKAGQGFAVIIPLLFALIPILIFIK